MNENAVRITELVSRLQKELRCGVCCSTFKDPIISTCHHAFCRECIEACFAKKRKLQCPICRQVLDKRSCKDSYQLTMAVQKYLKLSEAFKKDIEKQKVFKALPPEVKFCESQAPLDITIIPENDGKRVAPDFLIPSLPTRKRRISKPAPAPTPPPPVVEADVPKPAELEIPAKKDACCDARSFEWSRDDFRAIILENEVAKCKTNAIDDIDALFELIPSAKSFFEKNIQILMVKLGVRSCFEEDMEATKENKETKRLSSVGSDRRVTFGRIQEYASNTPNDLIVEGKPKITEKMPVNVDVEDVDDDEDVVVDSENEEEKFNNPTNVSPVVYVSSRPPGLSEPDATHRELQNENAALDSDLSKTPIVICCSRIKNVDDEVELCADFHEYFLSNSCRFSETVTSDTTHLVMMNSIGRMIPQKSLQFVYAIARKCVIVNRDWMVDCVKMRCLLAVNDYTILWCPESINSRVEPPEEIDMKTRELLGWEKAILTEGKIELFSGLQFMILRRFASSPYLNYKDVIELVTLCGGEIFDSSITPNPSKMVIVFSSNSHALTEVKSMENTYKCPVVTCEWVLDSISEFKLLPYKK
ncbi:unnamed protein product [Caenorhabditis bovis]|uniref:RING-type E3 ubiquitin transferase BRCA1 n=1 Tax=Caenorhabditis bovis TaxID=2654633 RepID=A0A8S1EPZ9_9PELO|nr:unnamed protein product [Caenorhabditis bovis]